MNSADAATTLSRRGGDPPGGRWLPFQTVVFGGICTAAILWGLWLMRSEGAPQVRGGLTARWMLGGAAAVAHHENATGSDVWREAGAVLVDVPEGTALGALVAGKVEFSEVVTGFGGWVVLRSGADPRVEIEYKYLGAGRLPVVGTRVDLGDVIGEAGGVGDGLAAGFSLEVHRDGVAIPAMELFRTPRALENVLFSN